MNYAVLAALISLATLPWVRAQTPNQETFAADPATRGWKIFGDPQLFHWNQSAQALDVTWDSSRSNSYFYLPLARPVSRRDHFQFAFDLALHFIQPGSNTNKPYTFQLAAGLLSLAEATDPNFHRGAGIDPARGPRNLVEFDYFPDTGFGATIAPTILSSNNQFASSFNFPIELSTGLVYRVVMTFDASNQVLRTRVAAAGQPPLPIKDAALPPDFTDFIVNAVSIHSYSDAGQEPPEFAGSILARGTIDNMEWTVPADDAGRIWAKSSNGKVHIFLPTAPGWNYTLQRSFDLREWHDLGAPVPGSGGIQGWEDSPGTPAFYRVKAIRP